MGPIQFTNLFGLIHVLFRCIMFSWLLSLTLDPFDPLPMWSHYLSRFCVTTVISQALVPLSPILTLSWQSLLTSILPSVMTEYFVIVILFGLIFVKMWINFFANGSFVISSNARDPTYFHVTLVHALSFLQRSSRLFSLPTGRVLISSAPSEHSTMLSFSTICLSHIHALNHAHTHSFTHAHSRSHSHSAFLSPSLSLSHTHTHTHKHKQPSRRNVSGELMTRNVSSSPIKTRRWRQTFRQILSKRVGWACRDKTFRRASPKCVAWEYDAHWCLFLLCLLFLVFKLRNV